MLHPPPSIVFSILFLFAILLAMGYIPLVFAPHGIKRGFESWPAMASILPTSYSSGISLYFCRCVSFYFMHEWYASAEVMIVPSPTPMSCGGSVLSL